MRKFFGLLLRGLAGFGIFLLALTVTLRLVFPSYKLRGLAEKEIKKQLHREARIGEIELSPWGLSMNGLRLSEVPDFSAGTFLSVDQATLHWALLPLLTKTLLIEEFSLDKPQIELIRMADGNTFNVSDLAGTSAPPRKSATETHPTAGGWTWGVHEIHLRHGAIRFLDRSPAGQTSALSDIELIVRGADSSRIQGRLTAVELVNPVYKARDFFIEWALRDIDPTLEHLNGWMRLRQGRGAVDNLSEFVATSQAARLAFTPILVLQNLDKFGLIRLGLPDFSHMAIDGIDGNYAFQKGIMKIDSFRILSRQFNVDAQGYVELARGDLSIDVNLNAPQRTLLGDMHLKMHVSGTLSHPKVDLESLKKRAFKATVKQLLQQPQQLKDIGNTLKNIFQ